jgi:hypothetical protein
MSVIGFTMQQRSLNNPITAATTLSYGAVTRLSGMYGKATAPKISWTTPSISRDADAVVATATTRPYQSLSILYQKANALDSATASADIMPESFKGFWKIDRALVLTRKVYLRWHSRLYPLKFFSPSRPLLQTRGSIGALVRQKLVNFY